MSELLSSYDYHLPKSLIAAHPPEDRIASRLLVLTSDASRPIDAQFARLKEFLQPGDVLVLNDTRVLPARLLGQKEETGGKVEVLLSRPVTLHKWIALIKASKKSKPGTSLVFTGDAGTTLRATVGPAIGDEPGAFEVDFDQDVRAFAEAHGEIPLPPYMQRQADASDKERYQTVFADPNKNFAAAAPTAGLHFDPNHLATLAQRGVEQVKVTLHVGPGTFLPVRDDDISQHQMHAEPWHLSETAAATLNRAKDQGRRVVSVGTTCVRVLESATNEEGRLQSGSGLTKLFLRPGKQFAVVDALLTNFHLPKSTLLMLVSAAVGRDRLLRAYQHAVEQKYRFFSYGDACFFEVSQDNKKPWPKP
ncbi:MAG: tRNA preQ1(34) S-adenosylmethionine ribosyltransferase-isomerase QueA [Myxococcales bacterium]|nr:tRNA preQ1(34) S-adenosylmethionine ribosyltransferase-isomerase QueA [Myxococcales bacterium]